MPQRKRIPRRVKKIQLLEHLQTQVYCTLAKSGAPLEADTLVGKHMGSVGVFSLMKLEPGTIVDINIDRIDESDQLVALCEEELQNSGVGPAVLQRIKAINDSPCVTTPPPCPCCNNKDSWSDAEEKTGSTGSPYSTDVTAENTEQTEQTQGKEHQDDQAASGEAGAGLEEGGSPGVDKICAKRKRVVADSNQVSQTKPRTLWVPRYGINVYRFSTFVKRSPTPNCRLVEVLNPSVYPSQDRTAARTAAAQPASVFRYLQITQPIQADCELFLPLLTAAPAVPDPAGSTCPSQVDSKCPAPLVEAATSNSCTSDAASGEQQSPQDQIAVVDVRNSKRLRPDVMDMMFTECSTSDSSSSDNVGNSPPRTTSNQVDDDELTSNPFSSALRNNLHYRIPKPLLFHLREEFWCTLGASTYGVGAWAIRDIPPHTLIDISCQQLDKLSNNVDVSWGDIFQAEVTREVREIIMTHFQTEEGEVALPSYGLNIQRLSSFLNHSVVDNCTFEFIKGSCYAHIITKRLIKLGEELTINYHEYISEEQKELPMFAFLKLEGGSMSASASASGNAEDKTQKADSEEQIACE